LKKYLKQYGVRMAVGLDGLAHFGDDEH